MVVLHGLERAAEHGVLEGVRAIVAGDPRGQGLADAEVAGSPGNPVSEREQAGGVAGERDGLLAEVGIAEHVDLYREREIEDAVDGGVDAVYFFEGDHLGEGLFQEFLVLSLVVSSLDRVG